MAKLKVLGPYLTFGLLSILLTTIGGIMLTAWRTSLGIILGLFTIILAWFLTAYVLRYFDTRPDVIKAREKMKELEKKMEQYTIDIESMRKDYSNMKYQIDQAIRQITEFNQKMQQINVKVDESNQMATAGFVAGTSHWLEKLIKSLRR